MFSKYKLKHIFDIKYGPFETIGWSPRRRFKFGYFQPADIYEAVVNSLVNNETKWIDVGGGSAVFPHNENLSKILSERCKKLVSIDPSENIYENPYAHEKSKCLFENYEVREKHNLATLNMVAEHVEAPAAVLRKLNEVLEVDGLAVVHTINVFSPIPIITYFTPFSIHYKIKKFFWNGEEKDTFPVAYKMNTRKKLNEYFSKHGFREEEFYYVDDLSTFKKFNILNYWELSLWKIFKKMGIKYPENNLLGIYRRI